MSKNGSLSLAREIFVPREAIFELWTDPGHLAGWYAPDAATERNFITDAAVDGRFDFSWRDETGETIRQTGIYTKFDDPARLGYTASSEQYGAGQVDYQVQVEFLDLDGNTRIEIQQSRFTSVESRDQCAEDWRLRLGRLETYLSSI